MYGTSARWRTSSRSPLSSRCCERRRSEATLSLAGNRRTTKTRNYNGWLTSRSSGCPAPLYAKALPEIGSIHHPNRDELQAFFADLPMVSPGVPRALADALVRYWAEDYEGCAYVLAPKIETMLRDLARTVDEVSAPLAALVVQAALCLTTLSSKETGESTSEAEAPPPQQVQLRRVLLSIGAQRSSVISPVTYAGASTTAAGRHHLDVLDDSTPVDRRAQTRRPIRDR
jgi:hypothetical protein